MEHLTNITSPWPFSTWGINIIGPLPPSKKQLKFLIVAIDYFTTWVEAEPLAIITEAKIQNFVWKNLVCRFGIPQVIISNRQMARHPQANGQTEVTNQTLLKLIKTRLEGAKGAWLDELPGVLWAYRTTVRTPTGETPFKMAFGTEAVVPMEVGVSSLRRVSYDEQSNEEGLKLALDRLP